MPSAEAQLQIEILPVFQPRPKATHVIFDFDGTLSWIRHGWPEVMQTVMTPRFPLREGETSAELRDHLFGTMYDYNGRPTPVYMAAMAEQIAERSGSADPDEMLAEFLAALDVVAQKRVEKIRTGQCPPDDYVVFGGRAFIEHLTARGLRTIILSGNPYDQVNREAALLDLDRYCDSHIYGHIDAANFSKQTVIERLMTEQNFTGENLIAIGDGAAEIQAAKNLGALPLAICSDETENGSGKVDSHKRATLLPAGAAAVIADYREPEALLNTLLGQ